MVLVLSRVKARTCKGSRVYNLGASPRNILCLHYPASSLSFKLPLSYGDLLFYAALFAYEHTLTLSVRLSFITVVVAFIGQLLARRAFQKEPNGPGVTLAEISMRSWVVS